MFLCSYETSGWKKGGRGARGRDIDLEREINSYGRFVALRKLIVNIATNNGSLANA